MSLRAMLWAFDQDIFPSSNKFVLVALANFCVETGKAYPSVGTICKLTNMHDATVRCALRKLVDDGVIKDTGKTTGTTGQVKVYALPAEACEAYRKTGVFESNGGSSRHGQDLDKTRTRPVQDLEKAGTEPVTGTKTRKRNQFAKPSVEECKASAVERGMPEAEGEKFFHHYEANGWRIGINPMQKWKSAMATWKLNWQKWSHENNQRTGVKGRGVVADRNAGTLNNPSDYANFGDKL